LSCSAGDCYGLVMDHAAPRRLTRVRVFAAVLALTTTATGIGVSTAAPTAPTIAAPIRSSPEATGQQNVFIIINAHRAKYGAPALRYGGTLALAAQRHADDMARRNRLTHIGSDGSNAGQRLTRAGFRWTSWAENIAVGYASSSAVVGAWLNSSGHRANMLNPQFRWMGVGLTYAHGRYWWCAVFAR
jgi:uncharacterized protein YkwD